MPEIRCEHCDDPVSFSEAHWIGDNPSCPSDEWNCQEPNWKERAKKAEAELTACYDEIFYTVPEAMPLVEKIKVMRGMEADALVHDAGTAEKLKEAETEIAKLKQFETYKTFQKISEEIMARLEKSGYGKAGEANTMWAMTHAACDEVDAFRAKAATAKKRREPKFEPIPSYGSHMTWDDFVECVESGGFMDDDGHGDLATATQCSNKMINPSSVGEHYKKPTWATHVVWYNK